MATPVEPTRDSRGRELRPPGYLREYAGVPGVPASPPRDRSVRPRLGLPPPSTDGGGGSSSSAPPAVGSYVALIAIGATDRTRRYLFIARVTALEERAAALHHLAEEPPGVYTPVAPAAAAAEGWKESFSRCIPVTMAAIAGELRYYGLRAWQSSGCPPGNSHFPSFSTGTASLRLVRPHAGHLLRREVDEEDSDDEDTGATASILFDLKNFRRPHLDAQLRAHLGALLVGSIYACLRGSGDRLSIWTHIEVPASFSDFFEIVGCRKDDCKARGKHAVELKVRACDFYYI